MEYEKYDINTMKYISIRYTTDQETFTHAQECSLEEQLSDLGQENVG